MSETILCSTSRTPSPSVSRLGLAGLRRLLLSVFRRDPLAQRSPPLEHPDVPLPAVEGPGALRTAHATAIAAVARASERLRPAAAGLHLTAAAVHPLVDEVLAGIEPLLAAHDLRLVRDLDARGDLSCFCEPNALCLVLRHLILHALMLERIGGHVRVATMLSRQEAQIRVLSREEDAEGQSRAASDPDARIASQRLLRAMGGALVLEPRRAGYLPICVALPLVGLRPALRAA